MDKVLVYAKKVVKDALLNRGNSIDMTCGNGNDTVFLAENSDYVYAFDIQEKACDETKLMTSNYDNVKVFCDNHINIDKYNFLNIKAIMFNLGYLPKGDKNITTISSTTIEALKKALNIIEVKGVITIVCYSGHKEGYEEVVTLNKFLPTLSQKEFDVLEYKFINQINDPPYLYVIERIK